MLEAGFVDEICVTWALSLSMGVCCMDECSVDSRGLFHVSAVRVAIRVS
jgi:hypothetical protein